jgi:hypothetical protein
MAALKSRCSNSRFRSRPGRVSRSPGGWSIRIPVLVPGLLSLVPRVLTLPRSAGFPSWSVDFSSSASRISSPVRSRTAGWPPVSGSLIPAAAPVPGSRNQCGMCVILREAGI